MKIAVEGKLLLKKKGVCMVSIITLDIQKPPKRNPFIKK